VESKRKGTRRALLRLGGYAVAILAAYYLFVMIHMRFFWKPNIQPVFDLFIDRLEEVRKDAAKQMARPSPAPSERGPLPSPSP
jgi:hypothetical protein